MRVTIIAVVLLSLAGCKKKEAKPGPPYTGPLTGALIMASKDVVAPFVEWNRGLALMEAKVGKPTRVKGNKYAWAVVEGETCTYVEIEQADRSEYNKSEKGLVVGTTQNPMQVTKAEGPVMNWRDCLAITGVEAGPPEDPNAPPPPTDGSAVPLATLRDVAIKGRSKWKGKRVKVESQYSNSTTTTSGGASTVTLSLITGQGDQDSVGCTLAAGGTAPTLMQYDPITVEGVVEVNEWMSMGGDSGLRVSLSDCTVVPSMPAPVGSAPAPEK